MVGQTDFTQIGNASYLIVPIFYGYGNSVIYQWSPSSNNFEVHQTLDYESIFGEFFTFSDEHFLLLQFGGGFVVYQYDTTTTMFEERSSILPPEGVNLNCQVIEYNSTLYMIMPYTNYNTTIIIFAWNQTAVKFDPIQVIFLTEGLTNMASEVFEAMIYENQLLLFYGNTDKRAQLYILNATGLFERVQVFEGPVPSFGSLSQQADGLYLVIGWIAAGLSYAGPVNVTTYKWNSAHSLFHEIAFANWGSNYEVTDFNSIVFQLQNATILAVPTVTADGVTLYEWNGTDYKALQQLHAGGQVPEAIYSAFTIDNVLFLTAFGVQPAFIATAFYVQFFTYNMTAGVDDSNGFRKLPQTIDSS